MKRKMGVLFAGPPNGGKSLQARAVSLARSWQYTSTSDLLRAAPSHDAVEEGLMNAGDLAGDGRVNTLVEGYMDSLGGSNFTMCGYPRTVNQFQFILNCFDAREWLLIIVILKLSDAEVIRRFETLHFADRGVRPDDNLKTLKHRLEVYRRNAEPIRREILFTDHMVLIEVDGSPSAKDVTAIIKHRLDARVEYLLACGPRDAHARAYA